MLTLELLEFITFGAGTQAHQAIGNSPEIFHSLNAIINQRMDNDVISKILYLVQLWAQHFQDQSDIMPLYEQYYNRLQKESAPFPPPSQSKYSGVTVKKKTAPPAPSPAPFARKPGNYFGEEPPSSFGSNRQVNESSSDPKAVSVAKTHLAKANVPIRFIFNLLNACLSLLSRK